MYTPSIFPPGKSSSNVSSRHEIPGIGWHTQLAFKNWQLSVVPGKQAYGLHLYTFPPGHIAVMGIMGCLEPSSPTDTTVIEVAFGTMGATGTVSDLSGDAEFFDIGESVVLPAITPGPICTHIASGVKLGCFGSQNTSSSVYFNIAGDWLSTDTVNLDGTVDITWLNLHRH